MFNSAEYGWDDMNIVLLGRPIAGITALKYKEKQEKANIYAKGKTPYRRGRGKVEYEGEIKILHSEQRELLKSHGNGKSILSIRPFDVVISYASELGGDISTDMLKNVEFLECEIDLKEGDMHTEISLPIIIGEIEWNV